MIEDIKKFTKLSFKINNAILTNTKKKDISMEIVSSVKTKEEIIEGHIANQMLDPIALEEVRLSVLTALEALPAGFYISAAQLVPYEQWMKLEMGERSRFGQRLAILVSVGELPLSRAEPVGVTNHYLTT